MKKISLLLVFLMFCSSCGSAKVEWDYQVTPVDVGAGDSVLLKVWSFAKKSDEAIEMAKKNAIHAVLFKGFDSAGLVNGAEPLVTTSERMKNKKFFENFFKNGSFLQFVNLTNGGSISASDRLRVGNRYKIGVVVSVQRKALKRELVNQGIIKKFGYGM